MGGALANLAMKVLTVVAAKKDTARQKMAHVKVCWLCKLDGLCGSV